MKKILNSRLLLPRLLGIILSLLLAWASFSNQVDHRAAELTEASLTRAVIAFGIARGLNGVISIAQGTEVAFQPGGLGVVLAPGQILDPINDLIERISWVMLAASTSLGIQRVLLSVAAWQYFAIFCSLVFLFLPLLGFKVSSSAILKIGMVLFVLRFGIALGAIGSEAVFVTFLNERYTSAAEELESTTEKLRQIQLETPANALQEEDSLVERLKAKWAQASSLVDVTARIDHYKEVAETTSKAAIDLVVVFIFQTVLFPLVFLALLIALTKRALRL